MNKILNINLGGYPFTIDDDAYAELNNYLHAIESHFSNSEGCDEILDDIEARIAELFNESLEGRAIVTKKELETVILKMGTPEEFGVTDDTFLNLDTNPASKKSKKRKNKIKTGKRLFRDPEDKVLGGLCSGIAAYFGIQDPLWVRLTFLALVLFFGMSVILYPVLWMIVPEAKTAGDKLKMKGEPATVSNIAKTVEEELNELSDKINEISKDFGSKKKALVPPFFRREKQSQKESRL